MPADLLALNSRAHQEVQRGEGSMQITVGLADIVSESKGRHQWGLVRAWGAGCVLGRVDARDHPALRELRC